MVSMFLDYLLHFALSILYEIRCGNYALVASGGSQAGERGEGKLRNMKNTENLSELKDTRGNQKKDWMKYSKRTNYCSTSEKKVDDQKSVFGVLTIAHTCACVTTETNIDDLIMCVEVHKLKHISGMSFTTNMHI